MNIGLFAGTIAFIVTTATGALNIQATTPPPEETVVEIPAETEEAPEPIKAPEKTPSKPVQIKNKLKLHITAYSSSEDETDDTPFITASGKTVVDGIIATNLFAFGTKARIPSLFGNKIFVIEDRMHHRFKNRIDIWMTSKEEALKFGKRLAEVEILE